MPFKARKNDDENLILTTNLQENQQIFVTKRNKKTKQTRKLITTKL